MKKLTLRIFTRAELFSIAAASVSAYALPLIAQQQPAGPASHTQVVLLGTGHPAADPDRSGPATAIVVRGTPYLVDFGPGVVRRAAAAARDRGIAAVQPTNFRVVFATHLHSDHTVGFPDLIFSPWTLGRQVPLEMYGPKGIKAMADHLQEAYRVDIEARTSADEANPRLSEGRDVHAHEIGAGVVYKDDNVTVTAFPTRHAIESYGYRFDTPDRSIVVSGDTSPTQALIDACHGCDVLIHEGMPLSSLEKFPASFQAFAAKYHTTTSQLAELATKAKPRLLIIYHVGAGDSGERALREMLDRYSGHVVIGRDLDVF
jgi:ribonuclease BN (tRNA processing enzyme)